MPSSNIQVEASDSALDPISRISEILFGLIMVLTFTGSLSAADIGREDVIEMLIGAAGCNLAWGIIDSLLFLMSTVTEKGRVRHLVRMLQKAESVEAGRKIILDAIPASLGGILEPAHIDHIRDKVLEMKSAELPKLLCFTDIIAALKVFLLVFFSMLPILIPFVTLKDPYSALRVSNLIAVVMLFWLGKQLGRYAGRSGWLWGLCTAVLGTVVVSMTIALGG